MSKKYNEEAMSSALQEVQDGSLSLRAAAKKYSVSSSSLADRKTGKVVHGSKWGGSTTLPAEKERELVDHAMQRASMGNAFTKKEFLHFAGKYAAEQGYAFKGTDASEKWWRGMKRRHPDFTLRTPEPKSAGRHHVMTRESMCTMPRKKRCAGLQNKRKYQRRRAVKTTTETAAAEESEETDILVAPEPVWDPTSFIEAQVLAVSGAVTDVPSELANGQSGSIEYNDDTPTKRATLVAIKEEPVSEFPDAMVEIDVDHMYAKHGSEPTNAEGRAGEHIGYDIVKVETCSPSGSPGVHSKHGHPVHANSGHQESPSHANAWGATKVEYQEVVVETASFQSLLSGVEARGFLLVQTDKEIQFLQLYKTETPSVKLSVCIDEYFNCNVSVHRQPVDRSHSIWKDLPDKFGDASSVMELLDRINKLTVCCGNTQTEYHELVSVGEVLTTNSDIDVVTTVARREGDFGALLTNGEPYSTTIRSPQCSLLTDKAVKCAKCIKLNSSLKGRLKRLQDRKTKNKSFIGTSMKHKDMTRDELCKKLDEQKAEIASLQSQLAKFKRKTEKEEASLRWQQAVPDITSSANSGDASMTLPESSLSELDPSSEKPDTKSVRCTQCGKMFNHMSSLNRHMTTHRANTKLYMCEKCGRPFKHRSSLVTHTRIVHDGEKPTIKCQVCDRLFYRSCALKVHMRVHTGEKPKMCEICGRSFSKNEILMIHKRTHTGEKPYICSVCGLSFSARTNLKRHMRVVHKGEKKYVCNVCGKCFGTKINLDEHLRGHTGEKPYRCTVCNKQYRTKSTCTVHMRVHKKGTIVEHSGNSPGTTHRVSSMPQKQCTICNKLVTNLRVHTLVHTGVKPYKCDVCDKSFTSKNGLDHHRMIHTGEKPYKCEVCELAFRDVQNMKRHMRVIHMGIKRFVCNVCDERFGTNESLTNHNRRVHAGK